MVVMNSERRTALATSTIDLALATAHQAVADTLPITHLALVRALRVRRAHHMRSLARMALAMGVAL